jgi:hypothetical protein
LTTAAQPERGAAVFYSFAGLASILRSTSEGVKNMLAVLLPSLSMYSPFFRVLKMPSFSDSGIVPESFEKNLATLTASHSP